MADTKTIELHEIALRALGLFASTLKMESPAPPRKNHYLKIENPR
jgi:hypothetical protein